jgi:hypothetical protein
MQTSWLNDFLEDFNYSSPVEYSIVKDKDLINNIFINNKGIFQKVVIDNKVIGYLYAVIINVEDLNEKYGNLDNNNEYVFTGYFPINIHIKNSIFKLLCKRFAYTKGKRVLSNIFKHKNINVLNDMKNVNIFEYFKKYFLYNIEKDYINNNVLNVSNTFIDRLKRYYKNKVILTYKN